MNRRILFAVLAVGSLALVATGCEKKEATNTNEETTTTTAADKKLVCEMSEDEEGYKEEVKYTFNFKGDNYDKVTLVGTQIYKDKYDEKEYKSASDECKEYLNSSHKGFTCNTQASGSRIYVTYQFTIAELDENASKIAKEAGLDELKGFNYDKVKSTLEAASFTCK